MAWRTQTDRWKCCCCGAWCILLAAVLDSCTPTYMSKDDDTSDIADDDSVATFPSITCTPDLFDFGAVLIGTAATGEFTIANVGTADLDIASIYLSPSTSPDFYLFTNPAPLTLSPEALTTFVIAYEPSDGGTDEGVVEIGSNDPARPSCEIPIQGHSKG